MSDQLPESVQEGINFIFKRAYLRIPFLISLAVGAALSIMIGYWVLYKIVVWYGT